MNKHPLQSICEDLADDLGLEVRSYSGRGMFGAHCFGVVVSNLGPLLAGIARTIADMDPNDDATGHTVDQIAEALEDLTTDNMGHDIIVYFPRIQFVGE